MATLTRKTTATAKASDLRPRWHVIDAEGQVLGRMAVQIAHLLKGKHKPNYSPHMLTGDFVIVVNAAKVRVTGRKADQKIYYSHSQYPGGLKAVPYRRMMARHPHRVIEHAVKGMLPHNRLGRQMFRRLKVYAGAEHPHESQVTDSLRALEKDRDEGVTWIGLPKPLFNKRVRKVRKVEESASAVEEAVAADEVAEESVPEEPASEAAPETVETEPDEVAEVAEPAAEAASEVTDAAPSAEAEDSATEEEAPVTEPSEEEKERGV